jgi:hypothetical protein
MTLMELLIAAAISIIASSGMLMLMAYTLSTGTQTIQMSRLTQDMRTTMQIITRELRRANYHSGYIACYGFLGCLGSGTGGLDIDDKISPIQFGISEVADDCLWFWYHRPDETLDTSPVAAFRRVIDPGFGDGTIGIIQMIAAVDPLNEQYSTPDCGVNYSDVDWVDITDPRVIDIVSFNISDNASIVEAITTAGDTQSIERIVLTMTARLSSENVVPTWIQANANATREIQEFITVRNYTTTAAP